MRKRDDILSVGVVSTVFPTRSNPAAGIFVKEELDHLSGHADMRLLAPLPNQHWFRELRHGGGGAGTAYPVIRPFALAFPRWFMQRLYPASLSLTLERFGNALFEGCDLIHAHNAFPEGCAAVRAFSDRVPVVVTVHGSDINHFAMKPNLRPGIVRSLNDCGHIICVSRALEQTLREIGVTTPATVIHNGIDTGMLMPGGKSGCARRLGLDPGRPRLLFAGNFVPVKGIEYLIDAFPAVLGGYPDCELVLLGASPGGRDHEKYRERIVRSGAEASIVIRERVPHHEFSLWAGASDVLVLPSIREGFGLVAAEALACGRPVVSTHSGGPEDIVLPGMGALVPPRDSEALARAIKDVLGGGGIMEPEELRASAVERFSYRRIAERIHGVYRQVVK